jgi:hypothetical protein
MKDCPVCQHPERSSVDGWLKAGFGPRAISRRINLSRVQIKRHAERCAAANGAGEEEEAGEEKEE